MNAGAALLGFDTKPHQHETGLLLDEGIETNAIQHPRRMGKTTSVWEWMLGRCQLEDDTLILTTAQSGIKARDRFMSVVRMLERVRAPGCPKIYRGAGHEALEWPNGSRLWVVPPDADAALGDAADVIYVDEPQALDPVKSLDFEQAVMPLMDTRENGQVVLTGTPGKIRAGWYWQALQAGLDGRTGIVVGRGGAGHAVSVYAAQPGDDWGDERVWRRVHQGIGTLTTIEKIRARYEKYAAAGELMRFAMEYLGVWPGQDENRVINADEWAAGAGEFADKPRRFGLAFDVTPDSSTATLMAGWRDEEAGLAHIEMLMHGDPTSIGREALRLERVHRVPIAYDAIGANLEVAEKLARARPKPKTTPLTMKDVMTAEAGLMSEIRITKDHPAVTLRHPDQPALNEAAEAVAWRNIGDSGQMFGRRASGGDITPIVAGANALLAFDRLPKRAPIVVASVS